MNRSLCAVCGVVILLGTFLPLRLGAQTPTYEVSYRPPVAAYAVLVTPHFHIIFEEGLEQEARETAVSLETTLPETQRLIGVRRPIRMPVILNRFNDRANGYVRPFPFKQEIEAVSIRSSTLTPRFPSWLEQVSTHELVHAVHAEYDRGFGVGKVTRWFAPDLARVLNLTAPSGMTEGIAVYRESQLYPYAGRLNLSVFNMEFRAAMLSDKPWSLSQVLEPPFYTRPFNRYYNGGAHFIEYLAERDSLSSFRRATHFYYRFPFLGYGAALWYGTGVPPRRLGQAFAEHVRARESADAAPAGRSLESEIIVGKRGEINRRPRWLDDSTLVVYSAGYDLTPGFYRINVHTGMRTLIAHQDITEDYFYSLTPDSSSLLYSRYVPDPFVLIKDIAEAFRMEISTGNIERLTDEGRVFSPVSMVGDTVRAVQNRGAFTQWVEIAGASVQPLLESGRTDIKQLLPSPDRRTMAMLVNTGGYQGLFRVIGYGEDAGLEPWIVFEDAVIYDADWSADGRYLLFSADLGGVPNVYAYDMDQDRVLRLTSVPFGALEPSLSPDGKTLAFASFSHERYDLATTPFAPGEAAIIPRERVTAGQELDWDVVLHEVPATGLETAEIRPYRPWRYLAPRLVYPLLELDEAPSGSGDLGTKVGIGVQGVDPLQRLAYGVEVYHQRERIWGEASIAYGQSVLRPTLGAYSRPLRSSGGAVYQDRGIAVGLGAPVILRSNVSQTYADIDIRMRYRDLDTIESGASFQGSPGTRWTLSPTAQFVFGRQQNIRDLIPNTGLAVLLDVDADVWTQGASGAGTRAMTTRAFGYLPFLKTFNQGIRFDAGLLTRNRTAIYDPGTFMPRGYDDSVLSGSAFVRYGVEYIAPLRFVDNGLVLVPVYVGAIYAYSFAEQIRSIGSARLIDLDVDAEDVMERATSIGGGMGLQLRLFSNLSIDARLGVAFQVEKGEWTLTGR